MTKGQAVELLGIKSFDYAIPESFNDTMLKFIECPPSNFVWLYDGGSCFGYPRPLTEKGRSALIEYNEANGTAYDTEVKVLDI